MDAYQARTRLNIHPDRATITLLAALARGKDVAHAAAASELTTRAARRRLGRLRSDWGRANNIALVAEAVRRGLI